jgi:sorbitol-specific phosphotransferase system component IIC
MNILFKNVGVLMIYEIVALPLWLIMGSLGGLLPAIIALFTVFANIIGLPILFARLNYNFIKKNNYSTWLIFPLIPVMAVMELMAVFFGYFNWGITFNYIDNVSRNVSNHGLNHLTNPDSETIMLFELELIIGVAVCLIAAVISYFLLREERNTAR